MENLELYDKVRKVPENAQKEIMGGRLKGKTDINPMWRIKTLTEHFGLCGIGWRYDIIDKRLEHGANGEIAAFVDINLYVKLENEWSHGIVGTGGSMFISKEKSGLNTSDECFKMALTDAISVACKALGFGADIYWAKDKTKYDATNNSNDTAEDEYEFIPPTEQQLEEMEKLGINIERVAKRFQCSVKELDTDDIAQAIALQKKALSKANDKK